MMLVTLQQARDQLRIDDISADDADLTLKIEAASRAVVRYLKSAADSFLDTAGDPFLDSAGDVLYVPADVKLAVLVLTGYLYKNRDSDEEEAFDRGYLPKPVTGLLYDLRLPSLA